jgi:two-component system sensor histidine kinase CiaH
MSTARGRGFRNLPLRVAAITTAIIAVLYLVVALAVVVISRNTLIANVDGRLTARLAAIVADPEAITEAIGGGGADLDNDGDARRFETPLVVWVKGPGGASYQSDASADLPSAVAQTAGPDTATIGGTEMRLVGGPINTASGTAWITIAQSLGEVAGATDTLVLAELVTAPLLLLVVFLSALLIGRRVAGPIDQARVAQLAFTADASHELRTPLTVIEAETSLALQIERSPAEYQGVLGRIQDETLHLRGLVDDLLWLARFDAAPSMPAAEPVDVGALATTTTERFRPICDQLGTTLSTAVSGNLSPVITAPAEWIARLLSVLLDNAVRHSPPGSAVSVTVGGDASRVQLVVEDTGPGIPAAEREQIFNRFHRASETPDGAGLGLAIADAIVSSTNGHWDVGDSAAGGARMAVWWPRISDRAFDSASDEQSTDLSARP